MTANWAVSKVQPMEIDRRSEAREQAVLPVSFRGGSVGFTRNVSAHGAFFEFNGSLEPGRTMALTIELPDATRPIRLNAEALVVRIEATRGGTGVGVRLVSTTLKSAEHDAGRRSVTRRSRSYWSGNARTWMRVIRARLQTKSGDGFGARPRQAAAPEPTVPIAGLADAYSI
jgi:hypothetical protein